MSDSKGKRKEYLSVKDLQKVLDSCKLHLRQVDEVWPNIYIGNVAVAQNKTTLLKLDDSTHFDLDVYFKTAADFIHKALKSPDEFKSIIDHGSFQRSYQAEDELGLNGQPGRVCKGTLNERKVLVHCIMGMSRSSTLVLAYLMIHRHLPLKQALQKLIQKRAIYPNRNFLALLLDLDLQLTRKKKTCQIL
ncbi:dual specificity protein phosphatase 13A-like isoform 3-T3 [Lycodopsis pacificus]